VYTEQARATEMASGVDGDDEEHIETRRLTGTQSDVIEFNPIQFNVLVVTKYMTFILLSRCHMEIDFDMRQRGGTETVGELPWSDFGCCSSIILHYSPFDHFLVFICS
jgi:hypothetical protein